MKEELVEYLKTKHISGVTSLWGEAKTYYKNKGIPMGGSYASWSTDISVSLNIDGEIKRFKVELEEVK